ncbi:MAG: tRNA uridine-5-carboxymethylaminomethyl(34) synthesis GTPase MnmE [Deltaproteobacteria bacterium]|nr:tRNA uridine-5-carboxymethylaminomethyl(34) synthesis GTPase MnmE [Deltaproteobacteria bacterium]
MNDTIAAISTPLGEAGIGIVRLSGPQAEAIARGLFRPRRPVKVWRSQRLYLGHIFDSQGSVIDEVLLSIMRAPHSYTREDVVEINCHSGYLILKRILAEALARGARLAKPGEFTLRAFLSGRLDLTQAEAVLEVIRARTEAGLRVAAGHLQGGLGRRLREVRQGLLDLLARVEAALDFPEEAQELEPVQISKAFVQPVHFLTQLCDTYREGRLLQEGLRVVIAGRPNVGKSSLLNRLLATERAIVTEIPGTTRDVIEEGLAIQGIPVLLTDTAGLRRRAGDRVEELGMAKTRERLEAADIVLYLVEGSRPLDEEDRRTLAELAGRAGLAVINKIDLPQVLAEQELQPYTTFPIVRICALTGQGLEDLQQAVVDLALAGGVCHEGEVITQARHHQHLAAGLNYLLKAQELLSPAPPWEIVAEELRAAIRELGEITGEEVGDDILERIFAQFCIGK